MITVWTVKGCDLISKDSFFFSDSALILRMIARPLSANRRMLAVTSARQKQ